MNYFLIRKLKRKHPYLFNLDKREEKQMNLIEIVYWASSSRLSSFVTTLLHENNAVHQIMRNKLMRSQINANSETRFQNGW